MVSSEIFPEVDYHQEKKAGHSVCGDCFKSQKLKEEGRIIGVLSDGLGSGVKASVLSGLTATMAMHYTAMNESILRTAYAIIDTLPKDRVQQIGYSTFCILDIDHFGFVKAIEYETPAFYLIREGKTVDIPKQRIPVEREELRGSYLSVSEFWMEKEDRLVCFTDGVSQSGMGSSAYPAGWGDEAGEYICRQISREPELSAGELARRIVGQARKNDGFAPKDDTSCCVVYNRTPRNLLICTGPPYTPQNDSYFARQVKEFRGRKILCGGTTAAIIAREFQLPLHTPAPLSGAEPPISALEGFELVTEGILTLGEIERILSGEQPAKSACATPAEQVVRLIRNSDKITFIVGTGINVAHQDPSLPVELEIRRNVVKKIVFLLETKYLKDVKISYL